MSIYQEVVELFIHYSVIEVVVTSRVEGTDIVFDDEKLGDILELLWKVNVNMLRESSPAEKHV